MIIDKEDKRRDWGARKTESERESTDRENTRQNGASDPREKTRPSKTEKQVKRQVAKESGQKTRKMAKINAGVILVVLEFSQIVNNFDHNSVNDN